MSSSFLAKRAAAEPPTEEPLPGDHLHDGVHLRFMAGNSFTSFTEEGTGGRFGALGEGPSDTILVGATPWRGVILGGGVRASFLLGTLRDGQVSAQTGTVGPFVEWYPDPKRGWHLGALAGAGVVHLRTPEISGTGGVLGVTAIAGYDWWIGPEWSVGIDVTASASTDGPSLDAASNGARDRLAPLAAGLEVGLAFH